MKKTRLIALLLGLTAFTSCGILDKLGFDTYDYMSESVTTTHKSDSEIAGILEDVLTVLITDSPELVPFESMGDAIKAYRDAVLDYMLETGYARYSGNTQMIAEAAEAYPEYSITQIIPEEEFEATMYRYFGGDVMITHKDGSRFRYLEKVGAYTSTLPMTPSGYRPEISAVSETEKTYRVWFSVASDEVRSDDYFALIIKREDGTLYIKKLLPASEV
ncbi:MAG: hypothetical protein IJ334_13520 [Clostridia bacterium]|nr:hypothetical protein [Clostridia bacterium]